MTVQQRSKPDPIGAESGLVVFSGTSSMALTTRICEYLGIERGPAVSTKFPDGETLVKLDADVRSQDCFVVQSTGPPQNDNLMELLIFIDCLRRASARRITAVLPYYGYARQDRKSEGRTPITAKLVANMLATAGADRVLTMNLHADQIQGFFDIPLDHLTAAAVLAGHFIDRKWNDGVVVSPDLGNIKFASEFAQRTGCELAIVHKRRVAGDSTEAVNLIGSVEGKKVMMFDDMITTAGTVTSAAQMLRGHGAKEIYVAATHGVFAGPALERLSSAGFDEIVVTDTIPIQPEIQKTLTNLKVLSVAPLIGEAIRRIHEHKSVSALFEN